MGFDAGEIKGRLNLDTTEFKGGFSEAHSHAETEGGRIREVLESIAEVASEVVGPAFGQMGQEIQSAFAGFSEGPIIGTLNAIGIALGAIREATVDTAERFDQIGLAAERAGVSTQFLGNLANTAQTVGVGIEQLSMGFKLLEERATQAAEGDKSAVAAMEKVGISSAEAAQLMSQPEELFNRVKSALEGMSNASERTAVSSELMGRAGMALTPVMAMSAEESEHLSRVFDELGANVSESQAALGKNASVLETEFTGALKGIAAAASQPILQYLADHATEIENKIIQFSQTARSAIGEAWAFIKSESAELIPKLEAIGDELATELGPVVTKAAADFGEMWPEIKQVASSLGSDLAPVLHQLIPLAGALMGAFEGVERILQKGVLDLLKDLEPFISRLSDAVAKLLGRITEGFQIVGSVLGYYDDPNHGYGDATKSAKGASSDSLRAQLRAGGALVPQITQEHLGSHFNYSTDLKANIASSSPTIGNAGSAGTLGTLPEFEPLRRSLQGMNDAIAEATNGISRMNGAMQGNYSPAGGHGMGGFNPPAAGGSGAVTQNFHLLVKHEPTETAHQLVAQLAPLIRRGQKALEERGAGAAMVLAAQTALGAAF